MEHVLGAQCIPTPTSVCNADQVRLVIAHTHREREREELFLTDCGV